MLGLAMTAISLSYWSIQGLLLGLCYRRVPPVESLPRPPLSAPPKLSIVVAACDEEEDVEDALRSKLACSYPSLEVIAVDDRSRDRTLSIMTELAREHPQLVVEHVAALPPGWLGKLHAMQRGVERSTGEWLLFSDADVRLDPGVLEPLIANAEAQRLDLVAVLPGLDDKSLAMDALLANFMRSIALLGRMWRANDDTSEIGVGVGAFNLVRRSALDASPGLAFLRLEVADDVALGALLKASGARCRLFAGRRTVHLPFYSRVGPAAHSFEKFGTVFEFSLWRPALFVAVQLTLELGLPLWGLAEGGLAALIGAAALLVATLAHVTLSRWLASPLRGALSWPIGALLQAALLLRAAVVTSRDRGIRWRGTLYSREELLEGRRFYAGKLVNQHPRDDRSAAASRR